MCGISASFNIETLQNIIEVNNIRGNFSFSLLVYDYINKHILALHRSFIDKRKELVKLYKDIPAYFIAHNQAPTAGLNHNFFKIHPAEYKNNFLYHNGLLKDNTIQKLRLFYKSDWDTMLLLQEIIHSDFKNLNDIYGSYACILINEYKLFVFRNSNSIIYYDTELNLSSEKMDTMQELPTNKIFELDFNNRSIKPFQDFTNIDDIYYDHLST